MNAHRLALLLSTLVATASVHADTFHVQSQQLRTADIADNAGTANPTKWNNPGNSRVSDDQRATATLVAVPMSGAFTDLIWNANFGFTIPADATINGIEVRAERQASAAGVSGRLELRTPDGPPLFVRIEDGTWPIGVDGTYTFGSPVDLWGTTWTPGMINDPDFGLLYLANSELGGQTVAVDSLSITVHYTQILTGTPMPLSGPIVIGLLMLLIVAFGVLRRRELFTFRQS